MPRNLYLLLAIFLQSIATAHAIDCNGNNVADVEDIRNETSADCNHNAIPDECDVALTTVRFENVENFTMGIIPVSTDTDTAYRSDAYQTRVVDFTDDQIADIVLFEADSTSLRFFKVSDSETISDEVTIDFESTIKDVQVADFDGDSHIDVVVSIYREDSQPSNRLLLLKGRGDLTFEAQENLGARQAELSESRMQIATADFDGDTDLDIFYGKELFLNHGNGTFVVSELQSLNFTHDINTPVFAPLGLASGDVDGDSDIDLIVEGALAVGNNTNQRFVLRYHLLNDGDANFSQILLRPMPSPSLPRESIPLLYTGDLDGDGDVESFTKTELQLHEGITLVDADNDGDIDVFDIDILQGATRVSTPPTAFFLLLNTAISHYRPVAPENIDESNLKIQTILRDTQILDPAISGVTFLHQFAYDKEGDGVIDKIIAIDKVSNPFRPLEAELVATSLQRTSFYPDTDNDSIPDTCQSSGSLENTRYGTWNSYLNQVNVLEIYDNNPYIFPRSLEPGKVTLSFLAGDSLIPVHQIEMEIDYEQQIDLILDDIEALRDYPLGIIKLTSNRDVSARTTLYSPSSQGDHDFAYTIPFNEAKRGLTSVHYNTFPTSANGSSQNWLALATLDSAKSEFFLKSYDSAGVLIQDKKITLGGSGAFLYLPRVDLDGGHGIFGQNQIGMHVLEPADPSIPYIAQFSRYLFDSNGIPSAAMDTPVTNATRGESWLNISRSANGENWLEISNPFGHKIDVELTFYSSIGLILGEEALTLSPHSQKHVFANSFLEPGQTGSVKITTSSPNDLYMVNGMNYYRDSSNTVQAMYNFQSKQAQSFWQGSYNTFLGQQNWIRLINTSPHVMWVDFLLMGPPGVAPSEIYFVPALGTLDLEVKSIFPASGRTVQSNNYGLIYMQASNLTELVATTLRVRPNTKGELDYVISSNME